MSFPAGCIGDGEAMGSWGPVPQPLPRCCSPWRRASRALHGAMARGPPPSLAAEKRSSIFPAELWEFEGSRKGHRHQKDGVQPIVGSRGVRGAGSSRLDFDCVYRNSKAMLHSDSKSMLL